MFGANINIGVEVNQHPFLYGVEYLAFLAAKNRCTNPKVYNYHHYGGRGIEFRFVDFYEFLTELGCRPTDKHSLDRINNDGHYERGNVKWSTKAEQIRNRRNSLLINVDGQVLCAGEVAKSMGLCRSTIQRRINKGWCQTCILRPPQRGSCQHINK